jgi:hypothetical protein
MNPEDYKDIIREVLDERGYPSGDNGKSKSVKKQMLAANILLGFSLFVFLLTWTVATYSWLANSTFPNELVRYSSILLGLTSCAYCCKTAYEYKADKDCESKQKKFP